MEPIAHPSGVKQSIVDKVVQRRGRLYAKDGQHEATLATFYRNYGDVRPHLDVMNIVETGIKR